MGRDLATSADVSASQKPFLDILSRDDVWDKDKDTESESEPSNKKRKSAAQVDPLLPGMLPSISSAKRNKRQASSELDGDSESDDEDDATGKGNSSKV